MSEKKMGDMTPAERLAAARRAAAKVQRQLRRDADAIGEAMSEPVNPPDNDNR